jgi:hypothetical protein
VALGVGRGVMKGKELIMLLSCYPDYDITAPNLEHMDQQSVSTIEFNAATETVELQTFKKHPKGG